MSGALVLVTILEQVDNKHACSDTDRNISDIKSWPSGPKSELEKVNDFSIFVENPVNGIPDGSTKQKT